VIDAFNTGKQLVRLSSLKLPPIGLVISQYYLKVFLRVGLLPVFCVFGKAWDNILITEILFIGSLVYQKQAK